MSACKPNPVGFSCCLLIFCLWSLLPAIAAKSEEPLYPAKMLTVENDRLIEIARDGTTRPLVKLDTSEFHGNLWPSPDGRYLLTRPSLAEFRLISLSDGKTSLLEPPSEHVSFGEAAWHPHKKLIALVCFEIQRRKSYSDPSTYYKNITIQTYDFDAGRYTRLSGDEKCHIIGDLTWSPDGERLAFTRGTKDQTLHVLNLNRGESVQYFSPDPESSARTHALSWSDGNRLAFICDEVHLTPGSGPNSRPSCFYRIRLLEIDLLTGNMNEIQGEDTYRFNPGGRLNAAWSPDGRYLFFTTIKDPKPPRSRRSPLLETRLFDARRQPVTTFDGEWFEAKQWSPDGSAILGIKHLDSVIHNGVGMLPRDIPRTALAVAFVPSGEMKIIGEREQPPWFYRIGPCWLNDAPASPEDLSPSGGE